MEHPPKPRGLAALPPERRREIASLGGKRSPGGLAALPPERRRECCQAGARTLHSRGLAHRWTSEEAAAAGRKPKKGGKRETLREEPCATRGH